MAFDVKMGADEAYMIFEKAQVDGVLEDKELRKY